VVFSTYQSIDVVAKAQADGMPVFDLIICDEAHRTTGVTLSWR
jgi:predicted helicase